MRIRQAAVIAGVLSRRWAIALRGSRFQSNGPGSGRTSTPPRRRCVPETPASTQHRKDGMSGTPAESYDLAVIGGGVGGLAAAALAQRLGRRTVLLEAHTRLGGCAGYFPRGP